MEIFGFEIAKKKIKRAQGTEVVTPASDVGSTVISTLESAAAY